MPAASEPPALNGRRPTSRDVARVAGVSRATVSYVLNGNPNQTISEGTRQRVLAAAAELAYTPSVAARMLRGAPSQVVLCLLAGWPLGRNTISTLEQLSDLLRDHGLTLVLHTRDSVLDADVWQSLTPAAVVSFADIPPATATAIRAAGTDVLISLLGRRATLGRTYVTEQHRIVDLQVDYLVGKGHRRLAYVGLEDPQFAYLSEARLTGLQRATQRLELPEPVTHIVRLDLEGATAALGALRPGRSQPTALLCANDDVALAVLAGMRRLGWSAPDDLAVIGVDDIPAAQLAAPALTTVHVDTSWAARRMTEVIVAALAGQPAERSREGAPIHIVERESA
jgi:DNA-binding LacI/PurR family transcriptional regulator